MARGSFAKEVITKRILETFEGSFTSNDGKEIRVPILENGEIIQVKVSLTAAKINIEPSGHAADASSAPVIPSGETDITPEEKTEVLNMAERLGL